MQKPLNNNSPHSIVGHRKWSAGGSVGWGLPFWSGGRPVDWALMSNKINWVHSIWLKCIQIGCCNNGTIIKGSPGTRPQGEGRVLLRMLKPGSIHKLNQVSCESRRDHTSTYILHPPYSKSLSTMNWPMLIALLSIAILRSTAVVSRYYALGLSIL